MPRRPIATLLLIVVLVIPASGIAGEADYARVTASLAQDHVAPRYGNFSKAAAEFGTAAAALCRATPPRGLTVVREAFHAALDSWMAVDHICHGPVELFMRNFRIHFWPDRGSRGARQLRQLLAGRDDGVLSPDTFSSASVAVQGFPTAERLLFGSDTAQKLVAGTEGDYPCRLLAAVAANIADMAVGMASGWAEGPGAFVNDLRNAGGPDARFATHKDAFAEFVKGMHTSLQVMTDQKLDRVLGKSTGDASPRRAESWPSGRSLRNLILNLEALRAMYEGEGGPGFRYLLGPADEALAALLSKAFRQTLATARAIRPPLARAVSDPAVRPSVVQLATEVRALKELVSGKLAPALGTPLGFNALDGD